MRINKTYLNKETREPMATERAHEQDTHTAHISRDDLERKLRAFQGDIKGKVDNQRSNLMAAAGGSALAAADRLLPARQAER